MTYLQFHLVFILPAIAVLALLTWRDVRQGMPLAGTLGRSRSSRFAWFALLAHLVVATIYTTPWDNYLVHRQVWGYGPERVLFTLGYVPFEEYLFFILQPLLTGLVFYALARRTSAPEAHPGTSAVRVRLYGALSLGLLAAVGVIALMLERGTYLGLILVWALPVLAFQWGFGGDLIWRRARLVLTAIALPTLYLWFADWTAIRLGIWWLSPELTTNLAPLGLPVEEALFFLVTNMLVVFGLTLALDPTSLPRFRGVLAAVRSPWRAVLVLWFLSMIPTPLIPHAFPLLAYISTSLLALGVLLYSLDKYGARAWLVFSTAVSFGVFVEWLGHTTGFPFGAYTYTAPGPQLFGVPLFVPLGWFAFTLIAFAVSSPRLVLIYAPLALVAWDLGLDPLMVTKGFWNFQGDSPYYGIPISNFVGWYVAGFLLVFILSKLEPRLVREESPELKFVFLAQAFLMTTGLIFFGLTTAALVTLLSMGLIGYRAWRPFLVGRRIPRTS